MYARDEYPIYKPAKAMHEYKKTWRMAAARSTHRGPEIAL